MYFNFNKPVYQLKLNILKYQTFNTHIKIETLILNLIYHLNRSVSIKCILRINFLNNINCKIV